MVASQSVSVSVDVGDLERATNFYENALSCTLKKRYSETWAVISIGDIDIHLLEKEEGSMGAAAQKRDYGRHWTPVHLDFGVEDVETISNLVERHGGAVEGIEKTDAADIAFCADPYGNGFCLIRESI